MMSTPEPISEISRSWLWWQRVTTAALVLYWLTLFAGTHVPIDPQLDVPGGDKTLHVVGYAGLAFLLGLYRNPFLTVGAAERRRFPIVAAGILLAVYGGFDELTQPLVGRMCDRNDWLADVGGIVIGLTLAMGFSRFIRISKP